MASLKTWTANEIFAKVKPVMSDNQLNTIKQAYSFAKKAHGDKRRSSGETYLSHVTQVAGILADLNMDYETIVAGFLHDVVEDSDIQLTEVKNIFGDDIALIVDGVTKISKIRYKSNKEQLAENYRKLLLVMCKDIRVMIVKLADRMNNMDTLESLGNEKQRKQFAEETVEVYAPIADRLGMGTVKWELQDMSLRYLNPEAYYSIAHSMKSKRNEREAYVENAIQEVEKAIVDFHIDADIYGRPKHIYSIYKKMVDKHKKFEEIYDLSAIRVLVDSIKDCYTVLGAIHAKWRPIPGRFKDYIAMPKSNMYQSLHTTVIGPEGKPLEVQIRTHKMHQIAEYGVAAHWAYKQGATEEVKNDKDGVQLNWFKRIIEIQEETDNASDFMDSVKGDLFTDNVYAFTPAGDVLELPKGSGPLDMAYAIHTQVGNKTTGARVNGKMVSLDYQIKNGDIVEIITSANATGPGKNWLDLVKTNSAKHKINQFFKKQGREDNIKTGNEILNNHLEENGYVPSEVLSSDNWERVLDELHYRSKDDLLASLGFGDIHVQGVANRFTSDLRTEQEKIKQQQAEKALLESNQTFSTKDSSKQNQGKNPSDNVVVDGIDNVLVRMSHCCLPLPGDHIEGYITKGRGITIHRIGCPNINSDNQNRLVDAHWSNPDNKTVNYPSKIKIDAYNRNGIFNEIVKKLNNSPVDLTSISGKVHDDTILTVVVIVDVKNLQQLHETIDGLKMVSGVKKINRVLA